MAEVSQLQTFTIYFVLISFDRIYLSCINKCYVFLLKQSYNQISIQNTRCWIYSPINPKEKYTISGSYRKAYLEKFDVHIKKEYESQVLENDAQAESKNDYC